MRVSLREEREETKSLFKHEEEKTKRMAAGRATRPPARLQSPTNPNFCLQSTCNMLQHFKPFNLGGRVSGDVVRVRSGGMASRQTDGRTRTEHVNASLQNFITARPPARPTNEQRRPTAQGAREAIHNNVDHEMIKRFLVCVRPRPRLCARAKQKLEGKALCA